MAPDSLKNPPPYGGEALEPGLVEPAMDDHRRVLRRWIEILTEITSHVLDIRSLSQLLLDRVL